jgi:hypothetical protein
VLGKRAITVADAPWLKAFGLLVRACWQRSTGYRREVRTCREIISWLYVHRVSDLDSTKLDAASCVFGQRQISLHS